MIVIAQSSSESESDSEQEYTVVKARRSTNTQSNAKPQQTDPYYDRAFSSLFPNYNV